MSNDIGTEIAKILDDYSDKAVRAVEHSSKKAATAAIRILRAKAPSGGKYATGFASKKIGSGKDGGHVVYNRTAPGLTHLIEKGHVKANQYGRYPGSGRTTATPHWAPAETDGGEVFEREARAELGG